MHCDSIMSYYDTIISLIFFKHPDYYFPFVHYLQSPNLSKVTIISLWTVLLFYLFFCYNYCYYRNYNTTIIFII